MADPQATIQALLDDLVASGQERGLQVVVYHRGDLVVDAWAGLADAATDTPVRPDTLFTVYSVSKGITATAIHILAQRASSPTTTRSPSTGRNLPRAGKRAPSSAMPSATSPASRSCRRGRPATTSSIGPRCATGSRR